MRTSVSLGELIRLAAQIPPHADVAHLAKNAFTATELLAAATSARSWSRSALPADHEYVVCTAKAMKALTVVENVFLLLPSSFQAIVRFILASSSVKMLILD